MNTDTHTRSPYKISVASGKGGTGKTTVAVTLFHLISSRYDLKVQLIDCDVEEPNDLLFLEETDLQDNHTARQLIPAIDTDLCTYCRRCVDFCVFNAIVVIPPAMFAEINPSLCHSCGACMVACGFDAISETEEGIGEISSYRAGREGYFLEGRLKIGSSMQTMMIRQIKEKTRDDVDIVISDAPPGTSCPVVVTVADADYVIIVTEPTPFGLYDLKLTLSLLTEMGKSFGIVINKAGIGDQHVQHYLVENQIEILGKIPYSRDYATRYANGSLLRDLPLETEIMYKTIIRKLMDRITSHEGNYHIKR